jgi:hypothetical protein
LIGHKTHAQTQTKGNKKKRKDMTHDWPQLVCIPHFPAMWDARKVHASTWHLLPDVDIFAFF